MANVFKKPNSPYWYADYNVTGNPEDRVKKSTKRKNKKDAQRVANQWEQEDLDRQQFGISRELTLAEALQFYVDKHKHNPKSNAEIRYRKLTGQMEGVTGLDPDMPFHQLSTTQLRQWQNERLAEGASKQTINHEINMISAAYNLVSDDYKVRPNLKFPRFTIESVARPLSNDEVNDLLMHLHPMRPITGRGGKKYIPNYSIGRMPVLLEMRQQNYDLVICLLDTGLRVGEMCAVAWDVVDTKNWTFQIDRTKNKDKRNVARHRTMTVQPTKRVKDILMRRYEDRGNNPYVFPKWQKLKDGRWLREKAPQESTQSIRKAIDAVGINTPEKVARFGRRSARSLRDTYATRLRKNKVGLEDIQELLGHSTPTMTQKYADAGLDEISANASSILDKIA